MYTITDDHISNLLGYFAQAEQFAFFDASRPDEEKCYSYLFANPVSRLKCRIGEDPLIFLGEIERCISDGYYVAGWFGYEFGYLLDKRLTGLINDPKWAETCVADFAIFSDPLIYNHRTGEEQFTTVTHSQISSPGYRVSKPRANINKNEYVEALKKIKAYIAAGDTYQVNFTLKLLFELSGSFEAFYQDIRRGQSVTYGAYIRSGDSRIMSFSPELFFSKKGGRIVTRPMKGTLKRGRDMAEDEKAMAFLAQDPKNRSENVMIVDLLRNDLARVLHESGGGEVKVESLFDVEVYESLLQMTSTISGEADGEHSERVSVEKLMRGLFPCGSVTGAPKIRTMEIIAELERDMRGVYTGGVGFFAPDGSAVFNVPIRTISFEGERGEMGIGSGVTHDSDPEVEWEESLLKGSFVTSPAPSFELIETLLWAPEDGYWLLDHHLARLSQSARYFYFQFDRDAISDSLLHHAETFDTTMRVRLTLAKDGRVTVSSVKCTPPENISLPGEVHPDSPHQLPEVRLSSVIQHSNDIYLYHKTTHRSVYDEAYSRALENGLFDYLFINEKGEVTEGCISNLIVYKDGRYLTPSRYCGLLDGVMRQQLLYTREIEEATLNLDDLREADALFCCNSVRGLVRVKFSE